MRGKRNGEVCSSFFWGGGGGGERKVGELKSILGLRSGGHA